MASILEQVDAKVAEILSGWNIYSSILTVGILGFVGWVIFDTKDEDTHPLLLARQAVASYVRQPGESAIFRSPEKPHGYPLRTGLEVKPPGAPAYTAGKDGDLRDVWRRVAGEIPLDKNSPAGQTGKIMTVFGREDIAEHDIGDLTREIITIGKHLQEHGAKRVAVYLPNSVEFLATVFGAAFYGFSPILIPYNQPHPVLVHLLNETGADALVAEAGSLPLGDVSKEVPGLRQVIWTVEKTSRHMDWNEVPEGIGGKVDVSVWHELVQDQKAPSTVLPQNVAGQVPPSLVFVWQEKPGTEAEIVEFTQNNIVAAIGALISAIPITQRMSPSDTFLPAESLTHCYTLCLTMAALFSHATVAINSVAGHGVDLELAARNISPTVIVASAETTAQLHASTTSSITSSLKKLAHYFETQVLAAGRFPTETFFNRLNAPIRASIGTTPGKLRLLFVSERSGANTPPLSSTDLSDLRVYTGARVVYALTAAKVAGAVAQTNMYDYRIGVGPQNKHSHFGVPLSCLEVKLVDTPSHKTTDDQTLGEVVVRGPSVAGGEVSLGITGMFRDDHTLAYV
ncbi:acetyl-CoA synthetase-like protein [Lepidopterella palustris CBS 459.81]|uniref:Acetyl-CoA synthetase-like protein n=1 Tax=Lepidopterella palustris CBS 459.81 TaxID=1314670 RepID=A0A8E2JJ05_9PEZI|nr:acetyl-CoA synthetase-like protein [Lepidopterella palustris CBS 459.81]